MSSTPIEHSRIHFLYYLARDRQADYQGSSRAPILVDAIEEQEPSVTRHLEDLWRVGHDLVDMAKFPEYTRPGVAGQFVLRFLRQEHPYANFNFGKPYMKEVIGTAQQTWGDHWKLGMSMMVAAAFDMAGYIRAPIPDSDWIKHGLELNAYALRSLSLAPGQPRLPAVNYRLRPVGAEGPFYSSRL